jgi:hypothetical protein
MTFENGVTAVFTVSAFSLENNRTLKIMGTDGEIGGCMEKGEIVLDVNGEKIPLVCSYTKRQIDILKAGGLLAYTKGE